MKLKTYVTQYRDPTNFKIVASKELQADGILAAMVLARDDAKSKGLEVASVQERKK